MGIRHGWLTAQVSTAAGDDDATDVTLHVEKADTRLHWPSLFVLLFGALGGLALVVAPFLPGLLPLAPVGVVLSLAAWFMVVARIKTRAEREFFELVGELAQPAAVAEA